MRVGGWRRCGGGDGGGWRRGDGGGGRRHLVGSAGGSGGRGGMAPLPSGRRPLQAPVFTRQGTAGGLGEEGETGRPKWMCGTRRSGPPPAPRAGRRNTSNDADVSRAAAAPPPPVVTSHERTCRASSAGPGRTASGASTAAFWRTMVCVAGGERGAVPHGGQARRRQRGAKGRFPVVGRPAAASAARNVATDDM